MTADAARFGSGRSVRRVADPALVAGRGRYAMDFSHYEPVPTNVQQKLVEAYKPRHEED